MTTTCLLTALAAACLCTPAQAQTGAVSLDLRGCMVQGDQILGPGGDERGRISANFDLGPRVRVSPDGGLIFSDHRYSEALALLKPPGDLDPAGYVFETRFVLPPQAGFYTHMLILSPRVAADDPGAYYRITYRFATACPVAWNNTGFYLTNTATEEYRKDPMYAGPIAGRPYRLSYGREYIAYTLVRDTAEGVNIRFYLHDTTLTGDDAEPLFEYTDTTPDRIAAAGPVRVQVGCGGLITPAPPTWFGGMKLYPLDQFEAQRLQRPTTTDLPTAELAVAPAPQQTALPNVFSDNMVLQRNKPIAIWGRGIDGDQVTVSLAGVTATTTVANGRFRVDLPALPAGGPHELTVTGADRTLTVRNILIGEVWALGGQSNMGFWLRVVADSDAEIARSNCPTIRTFTGWHPSADAPQFDVGGGSWKIISPELNGQFSAIGYYLARALQDRFGVPVGLLDISTPATGIECWMSTKAAEGVWGDALYEVPGRFPAGLQDPACHYNGKVAPVMPYGIAGIIWYQGDGSSAAGGLAYRRYIPALIADWREGFAQGDLPFLIVQIPIFEGCSPEMRESQLLAAQNTPNTGLAVILDTGDAHDIHPPNKRPVGERLALLARVMAYGEQMECSGPLWRTMAVRDGRAILTFDHTGGGLVLRGTDGFEVCGDDGVYVPAQAAVTGDNELSVWSDAVPRPAAARYAWATVPPVTLYNGAGLPASPFRTRRD